MGLDLLHYKAVATPVDRSDYFTIGEFPPEAFSDYGFDRYIQPVPSLCTLHTVEFLEDEATLAYVQSQPDTYGHPADKSTYWVGTPQSRHAELRALERRLGLLPEQASCLRSAVLAQGRRYHQTTLSYYKDTEEPGLYFVEAGYQRKGMANEFYEYFSGREIFVRPKDFAVLESFLDPDQAERLLPNLRAQFIENFELGSSFLWVSS
jgi:hypothetical protein